MQSMNGPARVAYCVVIVMLGLLGSESRAQQPATLTGLDFILDTYVRDGYVYYRALRMDRKRLDSYLGQLAGVDAGRLNRNDQIALWLNAYNALVLRTVVDHYPAPRRSNDFPPGSIRQIPGAFERLTHRVAGRTLTLDQIEQTVLPAFGDPRLFFALGRGAVGGGRLRSESFTADDLERQLAEVASECVTRAECIQIDAAANRLMASPIFSWREKDFVDAYAAAAPSVYQARSPVERAILGFVRPKLLQTERDFLEKNAFEVAYKEFDWTLNDLTGRGDR
jgi:hypothetical protein